MNLFEHNGIDLVKQSNNSEQLISTKSLSALTDKIITELETTTMTSYSLVIKKIILSNLKDYFLTTDKENHSNFKDITIKKLSHYLLENQTKVYNTKELMELSEGIYDLILEPLFEDR